MRKDSIDKLLDLNENSTSLIISDQSLPIFLNKLSDYIIKENNNNTNRKTIFDINDVMDIFINKTSDIFISDNYFNKTFIENYRGIILHIKINNSHYVCFQGLIKNNILELYKNNNIIADKLKDITKYINYEIVTVPNSFKENYILNISLKELLINNKKNI